MTGANPEAGLLSTYASPDDLRVDELLLRPPHAEDVDIVQPAFVDPAVGGEAGMPPFSAELLRRFLRYADARVDSTLFSLLADDA